MEDSLEVKLDYQEVYHRLTSKVTTTSVAVAETEACRAGAGIAANWQVDWQTGD